MAGIRNVNKSLDGRHSDAKLPPGASSRQGKIPRILETMPVQGNGGTPVGEPPVDEIFFITQSLANAAEGFPYSFTVQAISTLGSEVEFVITSGDLPEDTFLDPASGIISGVPIGIGSYPLVIQAYVPGSQPLVAGFQEFTMNVATGPFSIDPLAITSPSTLPTGVQGAAYSYVFQGYSFAAGNLVWSVSAGSDLPPGLLLDPDGTMLGVLSEFGVHTFDLDLDDGVEPTVTGSFSLTVFQQIQGLIVITLNSPIPQTIEGDYYQQQFTAIGNTSPISWTVSGQPTGMHINSATGLFYGIPEENGDFTLTVTAASSTDIPASKDFEFIVLPVLPTITVDTPANFTAGQSVLIEWHITDPISFTPNFQVYAQQGGSAFGPLDVTPVDDGGGDWHAWLSSPYSTPAGSYQFAVLETVTSQYGFSPPFTITAYPAITFTTTNPLPNATVGVAYSQSVVATGGLGALTYSQSGLPGTLPMSSGGAITGTPLASGLFTSLVNVTDGIGPGTSQYYNLAILDPGAIVITTVNPLPDGFEGAAYSLQFTQTGGSSPTWSITSGSIPGATMTPGGLLAGTLTTPGVYVIEVTASDGIAPDGVEEFTLEVHPALGTAWVKVISRDGAEIVIREGDNFTLTNGSALQDVLGNPTGSTLNLASASLNAPGTCPGLKCRMTFGDWEILNVGWCEGMGSPQTNGVGHPFYFTDVKMYCPGREPLFGAEYFGAVHLGGDVWHLVQPSDPKHPCRAANIFISVGGIQRYAPSLSNHMLDGGEAIHYRIVPSTFAHETLPSAGDIADAFTVMHIDATRIATWPLLEFMIDLHRHDPATYNVATAPQNSTTMSWNTWQPNHHVAHPGTTTNLNPNPYRKWHHAMHVMSQQNSNGTNVRPGWYNYLIAWAHYCMRNPTDQLSYDYFLALMRKKITAGMNRFDSASLYKGLWKAEGTDTYGAFTPQVAFCKLGTAATIYSQFEKQFNTDLAIAKMLTQSTPDPVIDDAFDRYTDKLVTFVPSWTGSIAGSTGGLRQPGHYLNGLWRFFKAHTVLGNAATAAALKAKAAGMIEQMFVCRDLSATCSAALGVATKCNFVPCTSNPNATPMSTTSNLGGTPPLIIPATAGYGEGLYGAITRWMVDEGTNAGRLADWQTMCNWYFTYQFRNLGTGSIQGVAGSGPRYEVPYRFYPDMSGGGATWNSPGQQITSGQNPTYNGYFHASWDLCMEPYMTSWFPGAVAPLGQTWAVHFERLARLGYEDPNTWFDASGNTIGLATTHSGGSHSGTGSLNYDIWAGKHSGIWCMGALA